MPDYIQNLKLGFAERNSRVSSQCLYTNLLGMAFLPKEHSKFMLAIYLLV